LISPEDLVVLKAFSDRDRGFDDGIESNEVTERLRRAQASVLR